MCLLCLFLFASIGNTLTPLTPIPVSDVGKSMLSSPSLSVLGDHQQFQTGRLREYVLVLISRGYRTKLVLHMKSSQYIVSKYLIIIYNYNFLIYSFFSVGGGSISTVIPPTDYYNSSSYPQYSSPYGGYSYGSSGSLLTK